MPGFPLGATEQMRRLCEIHTFKQQPDYNSFIAQVLSLAAQAEQRIAEQEARIQHLESLSTTDELTGLLNRRGFTEGLCRVLQSARRYDEEGVLAFIDLDGFKAINDTHGHEAGDLILRRVSELLLSNVRKTDLVARIGGDEFAVIFVQAEKLIGRKRAEVLRQLLNVSTVSYDGAMVPVRASLGCADYSVWSQPDELIRKADRAMYREKHRRAQKLRLISQNQA
ncbi:MAG: GGDEF domain-containing protein [Pseudomonadota bacterium]|jgi:diguanylate cyclase (GGDEF)-like protein